MFLRRNLWKVFQSKGSVILTGWNYCPRWPSMVPPSHPVPPHVPGTSPRVPAATSTPPNRPRVAVGAPPGRRSMLPWRSPSMESLIAMAADGAAIASHAPPRPPRVPTGPRRDRDPAELSPRRRRGTAGAPIDAAAAHRPTLPRCVRPRRVATAAAHPSGGRARTSRDVSRRFPSIRSPTGGPGEVNAGDDEPTSCAS